MHVMTKYSGNKELRIYVDEDVENPRAFGWMFCFHRKYSLGSEADIQARSTYTPDLFEGWDEMKRAIERDFNPVVILPVYLYDHGGVALSTEPFACRWDSGQVGFIFATHDQVAEWYGVKELTDEVVEQVKAGLKLEIKVYGLYANGECYRYVAYENGEVVDSCDGFLTDDIRQLFEWAGPTWAAASTQ